MLTFRLRVQPSSERSVCLIAVRRRLTNEGSYQLSHSYDILFAPKLSGERRLNRPFRRKLQSKPKRQHYLTKGCFIERISLWISISSCFRDIGLQAYLGREFELSESHDVISHMTIWFPIGHWWSFETKPLRLTVSKIFNGERDAVVYMTLNDLWTTGQGHSFWYQSISNNTTWLPIVTFALGP